MDFLIGTSYLHDDQLHMEMFVPVVDKKCTKKSGVGPLPCQFLLAVITLGPAEVPHGPLRPMMHYGIVHGSLK